MLMPSIYGESLFDDFFDDFPFFNDRDFKKMEKKIYGGKANHIMCTDIKEKDGAYELDMDLPGFTKDEIKITLDNGYLNISATKCSDRSKKDRDDMDDKEDRKDKNEACCKYIRRERYCGSCKRTFYVGEHVKDDDIKAEFKHGILTITIPKMEDREMETEQKLIKIND